MKRGMLLLALLGATLSPCALLAQEDGATGSLPAPTYASSVDWRQGVVSIDARIDLTGFPQVLPSARSQGEQIIAQSAPEMLTAALFPIPVDSYETVGSLSRSDPATMSAVMDILVPADRRYAVLSRNLKSLVVRYQIPLFPDLGSIFVHHTQANPPLPPLGFVPTTRFSGIVIYAKGDLPVHGENRSAHLAPCLFPRIWDENMDLVASAKTVDPSVLRALGVAAYSDSTSLGDFTARIGSVPFQTVATGIFGKYDTDVIISDEAARELLASPDNINLIAEGKILIIADLPPVSVTPAP